MGSQAVVNVGAFPGDPSADPIQTAFGKVNTNFAAVFSDGVNVLSFGADPTGATDSTAAFAAAYAAVTGSMGLILVPAGTYTLASTLPFTGAGVAVIGSGKGVTNIYLTHSGIGFNCAPSSLLNKTIFRDMTIWANDPSGATEAAIQIVYPSSTSFGYVTTEIEDVEIIGFPNTINGETPYPQTFMRGVILQGTWSAQLRDVSWFGPPNDTGASGACFLQIASCIDTRIEGAQGYYGLSLVIQQGYCEGLYVINSVCVGMGRILVQTTQSGWPGYVANKVSLLGLWLIGCEMNTGAGIVQCAFLTLGYAIGCDITRNYGADAAAVMFDFTDTSEFTISGCNFNGGSGGIDIAIQYQAANNSSQNIVVSSRFANMATAVNIIGTNGTVGLMASDLDASSLSSTTAFLDGDSASSGNRVYFRGKADSGGAYPSGIASKKSFVWQGPDSTVLLFLQSVLGATDNLRINPASSGGNSYVTLTTSNGAPVHVPTRLIMDATNSNGWFARVVAAGLTATGTNQGTAYAITAQVNTFTGGSGAGCILPSALPPGTEIVIFNRTGGNLLVYPQSGGAIESGSVNADVTMSSAATARFTLESANQWRQG